MGGKDTWSMEECEEGRREAGKCKGGREKEEKRRESELQDQLYLTHQKDPS